MFLKFEAASTRKPMKTNAKRCFPDGKNPLKELNPALSLSDRANADHRASITQIPPQSLAIRHRPECIPGNCAGGNHSGPARYSTPSVLAVAAWKRHDRPSFGTKGETLCATRDRARCSPRVAPPRSDTTLWELTRTVGRSKFHDL